jgi:hypothetical protein
MGDEKAATTKYVVQRMVKIEESGYWEDVATVAVPSKSKRDTVIRAALTEAKIGAEGRRRAVVAARAG